MKNAIAPSHVLLFLLSWVLQPGLAQQLSSPPAHVPGELLVQLQPEASIELLERQLRGRNKDEWWFRAVRQLKGPLGVWLCRIDVSIKQEEEALALLRRHPLVRSAQYNHYLKARNTIPNDPQFSRQWQYVNTGQSGGQAGVDLQMELVWDITTGGLTPAGDTIVVCIIDDGLDLSHEDFAGNLWINHREIPGNGLDDDGNGYIDDYQGWNTLLGNDDIDVDTRQHGTSVAGIVGARGNNGIGVSGVNWAVELMIVAGGIGRESEALEAYAYPLAQRRRYNSSRGREGAFVVATNSSWGVDGGKAADFPIWCAFYDSLGAAGILNVASTTNLDVDVEIRGDMPTNCTSEFLIGVTTTDDSGRRFRPAGFGVRSVDLAAFGQEVWTTTGGNRYGAFAGTSGSAPHVAGAIALLYSAPCLTLSAIADTDPAEAARLVRDFILQGVSPEPSLAGLIRSGGRLNILNSLELLLNYCGACPQAAGLQAAEVDQQSANLLWVKNDSIQQIDLRWRKQGDSAWQVVRNAVSPYRLQHLLPCTGYEFQISASCQTQVLPFGPSVFFYTDGCCEPPTQLRLRALQERSADLQWQAVSAAREYQLRFRREGDQAFEEVLSSVPQVVVGNLAPCTRYEVQIRSFCTSGPTEFSPFLRFRTPGCGACLDKPYCIPRFIDANSEWIAEVLLHTLEYASGSDGGYADRGSLFSTELIAGQSYTIQLRPGFSRQNQFEYFLVWIDLNQNGIFESQELVFDPGGASRNPVSGRITIPANAVPGSTRMRVAMRFFRPGTPCSFFNTEDAYGEVEDFCVRIAARPGSLPCNRVPVLDTAALGPDFADLQWSNPGGVASNFVLRYRNRNSAHWQHRELGPATVLRIDSLERCTAYEAQIKAVCDNTLGLFGPVFIFKTSCTTSLDQPGIFNDMSISPNPFGESLWIHFDLNRAQRDLNLALYDTWGRLLGNRLENLPAGRNTLEWSLPDLPPGVYWIRIKALGTPVKSFRVVKQ